MGLALGGALTLGFGLMLLALCANIIVLVISYKALTKALKYEESRESKILAGIALAAALISLFKARLPMTIVAIVCLVIKSNINKPDKNQFS